MGKKIEYCLAAAFLTASANVQAQTAPNAQQVLMYSATMPSGAVPSIFTETAKSTVLGGSQATTLPTRTSCR